MAIGLNDYESLLTDDYSAGLFKELYRMNDVLKLFPYTEIGARKITIEKWDQLPTGKFRDLFEDYDDSTGNTKPRDDKTAIYGGAFLEDLASKKWTKEQRHMDPVELQYDMHLKSMDRNITNEIVNGDLTVDAKSFDGIRARLAAGDPIRADRTDLHGVAAGTTTLDVLTSSTTALSFFRRLDAVLYPMGLFMAPEKNVAKFAFLMNGSTMLGIQAAAEMANVALNTQMNTKMGALEYMWTGYRGGPFIDVGLQVDQATDIILDTYRNPEDSANDCTEILIVKFGSTEAVDGSQEGAALQALEAPGVAGVQIIQAGSFERAEPFKQSARIVQHSFEWQLGLGTFAGDYCLGRLQGIAF